MTTTSWLLLTVLALLPVVCLITFSVAQRGEVHTRLRSRLLVTLKSGAVFDGVLFAADRRVWVLRQAQALGAGDSGATVPVDGEMLLFVADIDFAQKP